MEHKIMNEITNNIKVWWFVFFLTFLEYFKTQLNFKPFNFYISFLDQVVLVLAVVFTASTSVKNKIRLKFAITQMTSQGQHLRYMQHDDLEMP